MDSRINFGEAKISSTASSLPPSYEDAVSKLKTSSSIQNTAPPSYEDVVLNIPEMSHQQPITNQGMHCKKFLSSNENLLQHVIK